MKIKPLKQTNKKNQLGPTKKKMVLTLRKAGNFIPRHNFDLKQFNVYLMFFFFVSFKLIF